VAAGVLAPDGGCWVAIPSDPKKTKLERKIRKRALQERRLMSLAL